MAENVTQDKFVVGIDFGTESGRATVVRVRDGEQVASAVVPYPDGVISERLPGPGGRPLPPEWALQNPRDYLLVVEKAVPKALRAAGAGRRLAPERIIGIGTDFTCSTPLPARRDGTALCMIPSLRKEPHAWVKLWKHHAAQPQADRINEIGRERQEEFLRVYGGKYSAEWFFAKLLQIAQESPAAYQASDRFIEAADWIVWQLTGEERRSTCAAGYKAMWVRPGPAARQRGATGFPAPEFFRALHPSLEKVVGEKLPLGYYPLGAAAGGLTPQWAARIGLRPGTPVAVGNVDAHTAVPACTVTEAGGMVMIMGTSICHLLLGDRRQMVEGMCGVVEDGVVPGLWGYEAGQSAVGDIFGWFFAQGVPAAAHQEARREKTEITAWLERRARRLRPGESGLLALDWWNGNRSILVDAGLSGLLLGLGLHTRAEEIYRALIEATAFGTRQIIEAFEAHGVPVTGLFACGGLPERNPLLMQIYADVTGREIKLARQLQTCSALGAAMHAAVAAGTAAGGYDSIRAAAKSMAGLHSRQYQPRPEHHAVYNRLFQEYQSLHDYFGRGANDVMKRLKGLKAAARAAGEP